MPKIHIRDIRLHNNAGMDFPVCYSNATLLDLNKTKLKIAPNKNEATCKHCIRLYKKHYPWAKINDA